MEDKKIVEAAENSEINVLDETQPEVASVESHEASKQDLTEKKMAMPVKKQKKGIRILIRIIFIVVVSVLLSGAIIFGFKDIYGLNFSDAQETDIYIEKGSSTKDIAKVLSENGIIGQPLLFRVYCKLGDNGGFQYGYHTFSEGMSYSEITSELKKVARKKDVVEITVVEGWNLYDIAKELKSKGVIENITDFIKTVERMKVSYDYISSVPANKYRYYKYEGYFYPDKYEFYMGTNDYEGIAKKFFANFINHMDSEIEEAVKSSGYSFDQIVTIASLIQAEAGDVNQMGTVSSVFHNRLKSTLFPNLQSDVTINYVEKVIKPTVGYKYQELYDAYNTYKCVGLMPGPICNPTKEAIRAALFPERTGYYYFVTDHSGKYYYSKTLKQHQKNCATAQKVNSKLDGQSK